MSEKSSVAINAAVVAKIAGMAAREVEGVAGLYSKPVNFRNIMPKNEYEKAVSVNWDNGTLNISVGVTLKSNVRLKTVAEAVQENVKDKVQTMTGNAVAKVDVLVGDVTLAEDSVK